MATAELSKSGTGARWGVVATALVCATLSLLATGAASFSAGGSVSQGAVAAGDVGLAFNNGTAHGLLTLDITALSPGSTTRERVAYLRNSGSLDFVSLSVSLSASPSSDLDTAGLNGENIVIENCSQAWTEAGSTPNYTYTCGGTQTSVAVGTIGSASISLTTNSLLTVGSTNYYRFRFDLPTTTPQATQGDSSTITFTFDGTARDGTTK